MSGWITPKFAWLDPVLGHQSFTPIYPPVNKEPVPAREADRVDSITTSGIQQTVVKRVDNVLTLDFATVPQSDLTGWQAFIDWAVSGNVFDYHPDSTSAVNNNYYLMDSSWAPQKIGFQLFKFVLRIRQAIPTASGS